MKTITITVHNMISNWVNCAAERIKDDAKSGTELKQQFFEEFRDGLKHLTYANMNGIRTLFMRGNAALLVGMGMGIIDDARANKEELEVRVYHNDRLIGVIIDSEVIV